VDEEFGFRIPDITDNGLSCAAMEEKKARMIPAAGGLAKADGVDEEQERKKNSVRGII
jgi:hypothetical protein